MSGAFEANTEAGTGRGAKDEVAVGAGGGAEITGARANRRVDSGVDSGHAHGAACGQAKVLVRTGLGEDGANRADGKVGDVPGVNRAAMVDRVEELAGGAINGGSALTIPPAKT